MELDTGRRTCILNNCVFLIKFLILILDMYLPNKDKHNNIGRHRFIIKLNNSYVERAIL